MSSLGSKWSATGSMLLMGMVTLPVQAQSSATDSEAGALGWFVLLLAVAGVALCRRRF